MPPPTKWPEALCFRVVRPSRFVYVDISRTVRRFYIKRGMRVYPGGPILWVAQCLAYYETWMCNLVWGYIPGGRYFGWIFKVTGSKVKGHRLFCVNLPQCTMRHEHVTCCEGRVCQDKYSLVFWGQRSKVKGHKFVNMLTGFHSNMQIKC